MHWRVGAGQASSLEVLLERAVLTSVKTQRRISRGERTKYHHGVKVGNGVLDLVFSITYMKV